MPMPFRRRPAHTRFCIEAANFYHYFRHNILLKSTNSIIKEYHYKYQEERQGEGEGEREATTH